MSRLHTTLGLACLLLSSLASAEIIAIKTARALDVASGKYIEQAVILVDEGRITAIAANAAIPQGARLLDLQDMTVLPGLMDMHVHLTGSADVHGYRRLANDVPSQAITGVRNAARTLQAGFTTVRNVGASGYADVALMRAVEAGDVPGPRIYASGPSLGVTGGHCDNNLLSSDFEHTSDGVADGPWAVRTKVRQNIKYGANVIKLCATGGVLSKGTKVGAQQYTEEEMAAAVAEAHMRGLTVAAHAHGTDGIKAAIRAGVDSVEHASFLDDVAIKMARKQGTWLSMDIYNTEYILGEGEKAGILPESLAKERVVGKRQRESFSRAVKAGVNMVFGSDAGVYPHGQNGEQFSRMVRFGMSELQAIQAATINSARLLKAQETLGSLEAGRHADMVAVKGDPLKNIELLADITVVIKGGEVVRDVR